MSWQATLTNLYLRYRFKPAAGTRLVVATARARMSRLMRGQKPMPADVLHQAVPAQGGLCPAEWLRPADSSAQRSLLYFHGGGYFFGELAIHRPMCSYLSRIARADVLSVDYRLAPEHPCPAAVEDALAWYRELLTRIPASQILIGGDSAGGGLALACLQQARAAGLPMPAGIVLFSPWVDLACSGETMQTRARAEVMFTADSDAIITKGVISLLIRVLSGQSPEAIINTELTFVERIGLKEHLSPTRSNGLVSMIKQMKLYALAFKAQNNGQ